MAHIRKTPSGTWQAIVSATLRAQSGTHRKRQSKTFPTLSEARRWAEAQEAILRRWTGSQP